jgi:UDP-N-acetylmuramoyl-tripeptide--D-alanyl-D-alanine ligase
MDKRGELKQTGTLLNSDIVVLTNISQSHMEKLGSLQNIIKAKGELLKSVKKTGTIYINGDNENTLKALKYSNTKDVRYYGKNDIKLLANNHNLLGDHNIINAVCAYKIAHDQGVDRSQLNKQLTRLKTPKGRLRLLKGVKKSVLIDDTYNSSPLSATYAIKAVADYHRKNKLKGRKIAVLGGMLELGKFENEGHRLVGNELVMNGFNEVVLVGKLAKKYDYDNQLTNSDLKTYMSKDNKTTIKLIKSNIKPEKGDILLFKASQGIRLEKTLEKILYNQKLSNKLLVRQDKRWS